MLQELFAAMIALLIAWLLSVSATAATQPQKIVTIIFLEPLCHRKRPS